MSTHHATHAHPEHTQADMPAQHHAVTAAAEAQQQAATQAEARPPVPAPGHANENHLAPTHAEARPPVKPPESVLPPEVKLPEIRIPAEPPHAPAPHAVDTPPAEAPAPQNVYVMPAVFEAAKVKLFASILPAIEKASPQLAEGMSLELTNELTDPASMHGSALRLTLSGPQLAANYALVASAVNHALREHAVLGPVLHGQNTHTLNQVSRADGSVALQLDISGLSSAQYAQLVQSLAGNVPSPKVEVPVAAHDTVISPGNAVSM